MKPLLSKAKLLTFVALWAMIACSSPSETPAIGDKATLPSNSERFLSKEQWQSGDFQMVQMVERDFSGQVPLTGRMIIPPVDQYQLSTFFAGSVSDLKVQNGDLVRKGELLFYLQGPTVIDLQKDYWESKANLEYAKLDYLRQKELRQDSIVAEKSFQKIESDYYSSQARFSALDEKLKLLGFNPNAYKEGTIVSRLAIYAPQSGIISDLAISSGYYLEPNERALQINKLDNPMLELRVFERDLSKLKIGQSLDYTLQSESGQVYRASVNRINPNFSSEGSALVYASLQDPKPETIANGMYISASLNYTSNKMWALPEQAIAEKNGKYFALQVEEKEEIYFLKPVELQLGSNEAGYQSILGSTKQMHSYYFLNKDVFQLLEE